MAIIYQSSVSAGSEITISGENSLVITGNVGASARITVENGGLAVQGNVGDNVRLEAHAKGYREYDPAKDAGISATDGVNDLKLVAGRVFANGQELKHPDAEANPPQFIPGLSVKGTIGNGVELASGENINIAKAGDNLKAKAQGSFTAHAVGKDHDITAPKIYVKESRDPKLGYKKIGESLKNHQPSGG